MTLQLENGTKEVVSGNGKPDEATKKSKPIGMTDSEKSKLNLSILKTRKYTADATLFEGKLKEKYHAPPRSELNIYDGHFVIRGADQQWKNVSETMKVTTEELDKLHSIFRKKQQSEALVNKLDADIRIRCGVSAHEKYDEHYNWATSQ